MVHHGKVTFQMRFKGWPAVFRTTAGKNTNNRDTAEMKSVAMRDRDQAWPAKVKVCELMQVRGIKSNEDPQRGLKAWHFRRTSVTAAWIGVGAVTVESKEHL